jgi:hypothetical protein
MQKTGKTENGRKTGTAWRAAVRPFVRVHKEAEELTAQRLAARDCFAVLPTCCFWILNLSRISDFEFRIYSPVAGGGVAP